VKVLSLESGKQADAVPRFKREAELASSIGHENIIQIFDIDKTEDGRWYIVMELLEGEELRHRIFRRKRLPLDEVAAIAAQLGAALDAAHSRGIVHRDLKPENVFVTPRPDGGLSVKVLDFGISKVRSADQGLTRPGEVIGTPYYMAPEQARGDRTVDHRADVFAFGAVVYEALTGRSAFEGKTPNAVLKAILLAEPPAPHDLVSAVPDAVSRIVLRALAKEPQGRFQSAGEFACSLAVAAAEHAAAPARREVPSSAPAEAEEVGPRRVAGYGAKHLVIAFLLGVVVCSAVLLLVRLLG